MEQIELHIAGAERIFERFGYWPSFHDAEIHWIKLHRNTPIQAGSVVVEFLVHTWELTNKVDKDGYLIQSKHCLIHFRFDGCSHVKLEHFNHQNTLFDLEFKNQEQNAPKKSIVADDFVLYIEDSQTQVAKRFLEVSFDSSYGLHGGFNCHKGVVVSIKTCDEQGHPIEP